MKEIVIAKTEANQRVDKFLMKYFNDATKGFLYKMLRKKRIKLNKQKINGNEILSENDQIQIYMSDETIQKFSSTTLKDDINITFTKIYEDENILICNKPVGLLSQPDGHDGKALSDEITQYLINSGAYEPELTKGFRPGICNRLDRNTSGIVIAGKNLASLQEMNHIIANRQIDKHYLCIVAGKVEQAQTIEGYLEKNTKTNKVSITRNKKHGNYIKTIYSPIKTNSDFSLLDVQIITGKSHQIRVHLASMGHPLIGDYKYGKKHINDKFKKQFNLTYQLLHAYKIQIKAQTGLLHYLNGKEFIAPVPEKFEDIKKTFFRLD